MRYATIRTASIGTHFYVYGRGANSTYLSAFDTLSETWVMLPRFSFLTDSDGFTLPQYYKTVRMVANGFVLYIAARSATGIVLSSFDTLSSTWVLRPNLNMFTDAAGWYKEMYYDTMRIVTTGTSLWLYMRGPNGINLIEFTIGTQTWDTNVYQIAHFSDGFGWGFPYFYETMELLWVNNKIFIFGRGGADCYVAIFALGSHSFIMSNLLPQLSNPVWMAPKYYETIKVTTYQTLIYVTGRGSSSILNFAYDPSANAWAILSTVPAFTDTSGWDQIPYYHSLRLVCVGNKLYEVGRKLAGIQLSEFSIAGNAWTVHPEHFFPCYNTCLTCQGSTQSDCVLCWVFANLSGPAPSACVCISHYFLEVKSGRCYQCHVSCGECNGPESNMCSSCPGNQTLKPTKECGCSSGFFLDLSSMCGQCHPSCQECVSNSPNDCSQCPANSRLAAAPISSCLCISGYFWKESDKQCVSCDISCLNCIDIGENNCVRCYEGAFLSGPAPSNCICNPGFYQEGNSRNCVSCSPECISCVSRNECRECSDKAILRNGACEGKDGFYLDPQSMRFEQCIADCKSCIDKFICTSCCSNASLHMSNCLCDDGYFGSPDECAQCQSGCISCNDTFHCDLCDGDCLYSEGVCKQYEEFTANATTDVHQNDVILTFTHRLSRPLEFEDYDVTITDSDETVYAHDLLMSELLFNQSYNISIRVSEGYLPSDNIALFTFKSPSTIIDFHGKALKLASLTTALHPIGSSSTHKLSSKPSTTIGAVVSSATASGFAIAAVSGNPSSLFILINNVQMLTYFSLSCIPLSQGLKLQLASMNVQSIVANLFSLVLEGGSQLPQFASDYGMNSSLLLLNVGVMVTVGIFLLASWPVSVLLARVKVKAAAKYFSEVKRKYKWDYFIKYCVECYLDFCIAVFLQVSLMCFDTASCAINSLLGLLFAVLVSATPIFLFVLSYRHRTIVISKDFSSIQQWSALYEELSIKKSWLSSLFYHLFLVRRFVYALTLIFMHDYAFAQSMICICHSFVVSTTQTVASLIAIRPLRSKFIFFVTVLSELSIFLIFVLTTAFHFSISSVANENIDLVCVLLCYIAIGVPTVAGFISLIIEVRAVWKKFVRVKYAVKEMMQSETIQRRPLREIVGSLEGI